jgi:hypothetical protein
MSEQLVHFEQTSGFSQSLPIEVARRLSSHDPTVLDTLDPNKRDRFGHGATALIAADVESVDSQARLERHNVLDHRAGKA